ncbi:YihY/virulence factor BrkB family protein [Halomonas vilamensis]|uniref:YihY/virulence factor BrkB family protein n=1 Tax=Vreelandella vilamensis TaxID=531309 RepID=A0ABU1H064_9GAMM|nr:YihY/virulence factor BrkB family protein [Halomonas vilamensis]MDR5897663.1 YihY/virulence factor BrkB family protein [Halomonas vilamensis]
MRPKQATHHADSHSLYVTAKHIARQLERDRVTMLAAGVAFYALLALFPAIAAVISMWGLLFDPFDAGQQLRELSQVLPPRAARLVNQQTQNVAESASERGGIAALAGVVAAVFVASKAVRGLMVGLNVVYGEKDQRSRLVRSVVVLALTFGLVGMTLVTLGFIALVPFVVDVLQIASPLDQLIDWLRWPALLVIMTFVIALLYRFGPYRESARWEWLNAGTLVATLLWLLGSAGLSLYVRYFAYFSQLYGSLGAVVMLMLWFWLSAFVVLLGAEINAYKVAQRRK